MNEIDNSRLIELEEKVNRFSEVLSKVVDKLDSIEMSVRELNYGGSGPAVETNSLGGGGAGRANENDDIVLDADFMNDSPSKKGKKDKGDKDSLGREERRLSSLHPIFIKSEISNNIARIVQKKDFEMVLKKLEIGAYCDHISAMHDFEEANGIKVNLISTFSLNLKDNLVFDCRERGDAFMDRAKLSKKSNEEVDIICRESMRPETRADFLTLFAKHVVYWVPDSFKPGFFNFVQQYNSYQNYSEKARKMYLLMSFHGEKEGQISLFKSEKVPECDVKDVGMIDCFKKGLPHKWADHFFKLLPKPKGGKWQNFLDFLDALNKLTFNEYKIYTKHVRRFFTLYDDRTIVGGKLKALSEYAAEEDPMDGNPMVITQSEYEERVEEEVFYALYSLGVPGVPTMSTHKFGNRSPDTKKLACYHMAIHGSCPKGAECKFSHDRIELRAKARELHKQISISPFFSVLENSEEVT